MFTLSSLWIPFTIVAAFGQVARNAMQRQLTGPLGTWGATNIRFLFGLPFSVVFFVLAILVTGDRTMLSYLMKPLHDQFMRSFREK